ncbi:TetR/AcrR family transcriptional regulator [Allokutzneria sp. A3M-2-11 16]|uniref:TetR/AcrR family transcriptional regulator n=1 Tax=Allokutzneria sp. A3M-2-11 16 TaxID=2962043 RepID=UPI0020B73021|nr:TetR/AcrR family transcriptional regulator [Allokutzneria sp. A3M-2-11 16]MCP3798188.1 TetR/AcrR family transcriptional regulator [Allokutzneria sp. A3M-2-11 16]
MSARERILDAAERLFAESGFDATPTSRIAELAGVPKGLVHYYFRRKPDLLAELVRRLPEDSVDAAEVVVPGDVELSLRRLVAALDERLDSSPLLSHLLWRESDTHDAVREAMHGRFDRMVQEIRDVLVAVCPEAADVDSAAELLGLAVSYRHSVARHTPDWSERGNRMEREVAFIARALRAEV